MIVQLCVRDGRTGYMMEEVFQTPPVQSVLKLAGTGTALPSYL